MPVRPNYMNVDRFQSLLADHPYDAVIASSFKNVYYTSGALIETQRRIPLRLALTVWPKKGEPTLIVGDIEENLARRESHLEDVRSYVEFQESPIERLAEVLREKGLSRARLGIEWEHLMICYYGPLLDHLPSAELLPADRFFDRVRMVKTNAEIELMASAARTTERAIRAAYEASRIEESEKQVAWRIMERLMRDGADSVRFLVLGAGENSVFAHHIPTERRLKVGDTVRLDVGAYFHGYASDIARMAFVEGASQRQLDRYQQMVEIHQSTLASIRPGILAREVYEACRKAYDDHGLRLDMPHVGHGFGVDGGHEEPLLQPANEYALEPGMVLAVEPVLHDEELGGYHLEDLLLVTESGYELLSNVSQTDTPVIIGAEPTAPGAAG